MEELFLDAYARFNSRESRKVYGKKEINANVCFNKRSGNNDRKEHFDQELYDERY